MTAQPLRMLSKTSEPLDMAEAVDTKLRPSPHLERSSLSGDKAFRTHEELPSKGTEIYGLDGPRHESTRHDSVLEPQCVTPDLGQASRARLGSDLSGSVIENPQNIESTTGQIEEVALSVELDGDHSQDPPDSGDNHSLGGADDEFVDNQSVISDDSDFRDKLMDVFDVILSVESRLRAVEMKPIKKPVTEQKAEVDESHEQKTEVETSKRSEKQSCVPRIKILDWYNFKHKWNDDKKYAIEVLKGPAKYYQDWSKDQQKYEKSKKIGNTPVRLQSDSDPEQDALLPQDIPERIRIISSPLIAMITELDPLGFPLDLTPGIMLRPYRRLARMEDDLMKHLSGLEAKWGVAEKEELERKAETKSNVTEGEHPTCESSEDGSDRITPRATPQSVCATEKPIQTVANEPKDERPTESDPLTDSIEALRDLRCLKQFYEVYIHPTVNRLRDRTARKIRFADLWYLFPHGEQVFVPAAHKTEVSSMFTQSVESSTAYQSVYRVYDHSGGRAPLSLPRDDEKDDFAPKTSSTSRVDPFVLMCYHIDWTGKSYSPVFHEIEIKAFDNERDITSLELYPTGYHANFKPVGEQLLKRGRKFLKLTEPTHLNYYGQTYVSHPCGAPARRRYFRPETPLSATPFVDSEVMVDFETSSQEWRPDFGLHECRDFPRETVEDYDLTVYQDKEHSQVVVTYGESMFEDYDDEKWLREQAREQDSFLHDWDLYEGSHRSEPIQSLSREEDLILLPSRVMGYSYRDRTFNAFNIERLQPITQKSEGFAGLELPKGHQKLVEALVREHFIKKEAYEKHGISTPGMDIVSGKGKGLIMLLHGFPGVGKTSTAECVAQSTGRPLFPITCGDLGLEPGQVEESLTAKFRLAAKWNCVMLIDEADIFLARRDKLDLQRNALVSVFLRVLEYYEGILILTTNRVGVFDDAFKSRVHVSLCYPPLTKPQTIRIWEKNLNRLKKIEDARAQITETPRLRILDAEILAYAKEHYKEHENSKYGLWNGRQIRNAFQTAAALAYHDADADGPILTPNLFKQVAKTTDEFDKYINAVHGEKNEEQRAYDHLERIDQSPKQSNKRSKQNLKDAQPATPVSHPRDKHFANKGLQDMQESGYASIGGRVQVSEHATLASSMNSSRIFTETTLVPNNIYASPGASWHSSSPSVTAKATGNQNIDQGQGHNVTMDSDDDDDDDDDDEEEEEDG